MTAADTLTPEELRALPSGQLAEIIIDLRERVEDATRHADRYRDEAQRWRTERAPDAEAEAIAGCVRVLDALGETSGSGVTRSTVPSTSRPRSDQVERILQFLAVRYGCTLPPAQFPEVLDLHVTDDLRAGDDARAYPREGVVGRIR